MILLLSYICFRITSMVVLRETYRQMKPSFWCLMKLIKILVLFIVYWFLLRGNSNFARRFGSLYDVVPIFEMIIRNDCNWTRTQNHLVHKRTLNHLAKLTKWLSCVLSTYLYGVFDCIFLSCHVRVLEWIHTL